MNKNLGRQAGALILAIDDNDKEKVQELLEVVAKEPMGVNELVWQLVSVSIEMMKLVAPDDWRAQVNLAILDFDSIGPDGE